MKAGDHIRIDRDGGSEHAIAVGDRTVIHFAAGQGVKRSLISELCPHGGRVAVVTHPGRVFPRKQVVARAFSRFGEAAYMAMFQDSGSFADWCKTGRIPARPIAVPLAQPASAPAAIPLPAAKGEQRAARPRRAGAGPAAKKPAVKKPAARKPPKAARKARATTAKPARAAKASARGGAKKRKAAPSRGSGSRASARPAGKGKRTAKVVAAKRPAPRAKAAAPARTQKRGASARSAKSEKRRKASAGR